MSSVTFFNQIN